MRTLALVLAASVSLASCGLSTQQSPAPLGGNVVIDDRGIRYAFLTLDAMASLADAGIKAGWLVPRSAKALAIADGLDKTRHFLNAASHAQRAGSLTDYRAAFDQAQAAMQEVQTALGKKTSFLTPISHPVSVETTIARLRAA